MTALRARTGLTLVEVLVALAIFVAVASLVGAGIVQAMRLQALNEASTSLQAKLRRVTEVIAQDLRSAVFGGVTDVPFGPSSAAVSFTLAEGGQGFQAVEATTGDFVGASNVHVFAAADPGMAGGRALMINGVGAAVSFDVGTVSSLGDQLWDLVIEDCPNPIAYAEPIRLFPVEAVGFRFDAGSGMLFRGSSGDAADLPLAFDLTDFEIAYVYDGDDGSTLVRSVPFFDDGSPARVAEAGGVNYTMVSLRVMVSAEQPATGGRTVQRSYVSQIPLPAGGNINLRSVVSCS